MARTATKRRAPAKPVAPRPAPKSDTARKVHVVKCWPDSFESIANGFKTADLRQDDRNYREGDDIVMREFRPQGIALASRYTGRELRVCITHTLSHEELQALGLVSDAALRDQKDPAFRERAITAATGDDTGKPLDDKLIDRIDDAMKWAQSRLPEGGGKRLVLLSIKVYPDSLRSE